jgi:hypothetical protein
VELKKTREERERNNRVERSRISLSLGGGDGEAIECEEKVDNDMEFENLDDRARSAAIIAPIPMLTSRRFYEDRYLTSSFIKLFLFSLYLLIEMVLLLILMSKRRKNMRRFRVFGVMPKRQYSKRRY